MTIHELLQAAGLTANDEIPIWDVDGTGEPTKKITAQQLAAAVVALANLVTGVKGNAEGSYRNGNVNLTPANIGAVALTGDTITGELTYKVNAIDASKTDNGVTSTQYPTTLIVRDSANRILMRNEATIYADGKTGANWYVRNYNTNGESVGQKGIRMSMDKTGALTYTFSDPDKARSALGVTPANIGAKATQAPISSPSASGTAVEFIDTVSQDEQGVILPTKKAIPIASSTEYGLMSATDKAKLDDANACAQSGPSTIISVSDAIEANAIDATIDIKPAQPGSGVPSPDNVRPISGWTGARVTRCGKNFAEIDSARIGRSGTHNGITWRFNEDGSMTLNGTKTTTTASILIWNFANAAITGGTPQSDNKKHIPNGDYFIYSGHDKATLQVYGSNDENAGSSNSYYIVSGNLSPVRFTIDDTYKYNWIRLNIAGSAVFDNYTFYPMVRLASDTGTEQAPYTGATYDIAFPASAGTVYGGTLDVTTGLLTVTHKILELDGVTSGKKFTGKSSLTTADQYLLSAPDGWTFDADSNRFVTDEEADAYGLRCSVGEYYSSWSGFGSKYCYTAYIERPRLQMRINFLKSMGIDTIEKANEWAAGLYAAGTPCQFIYPLATPQTYQLSPTEVTLLLGENNVWADCGEMTVSYLKSDSLCINQAIRATIIDSVHVTLGSASWSDVYTRLSRIDGGQSAFFWITTTEIAQFVSGTANMAWTSGIVTNLGNGNFRFAVFLNGTLFSWNITGLTSTSGTVGPITQNVVGVKGNNESSYRTGNVNLTPANIGAAPIPEGTNLPFTGSDDLNDSPAGWSICNEVTDAAERANAHMPFQSWCYICTISSSTAGSVWKTQMAFPWYNTDGAPAIRQMRGDNGTWTKWTYYGLVSKTVASTTDANGNISLDLNQQSYVVTAVKVLGYIATPWVSGSDNNWHARIMDVNGSAHASQSVTATVYYRAV